MASKPHPYIDPSTQKLFDALDRQAGGSEEDPVQHPLENTMIVLTELYIIFFMILPAIFIILINEIHIG